jgi:hypothetical protein
MRVSIIDKLRALRFSGVFKVNVTTPLSSARLTSSGDAGTSDEAVMALFPFAVGERAIMPRQAYFRRLTQ